MKRFESSRLLAVFKRSKPLEQRMSTPVFLGRLVFFSALMFGCYYLLTNGIRFYAYWKVTEESWPEEYEHLRKLHRPLETPKQGEWLAEHLEMGQTVAEYKKDSNPGPLSLERRTIYIQPIGAMPAKWKEILQTTSEYLSVFFCLPTTILEPISLELIPPSARRTHPHSGRQLLSTYIIRVFEEICG